MNRNNSRHSLSFNQSGCGETVEREREGEEESKEKKSKHVGETSEGRIGNKAIK